MIGSLTIDKSSSNLSYFLKSIKIIADNGGEISRSNFVSEMASFMGTYAEKDGKENRTPYNKLKLVQYFGFAIISSSTNGSLLSLTPRGTILSYLIAENSNEEDPELRYFITENSVDFVRQLFLDSIFYDSFGKRNCGAERSESDTEPTKIILKLLSEFGLCSSDEIFYAIYSINGGKDGVLTECLSWNEIVDNIQEYRIKGKNYDGIFLAWGLTNFVKDPKILNILSNPCVDIIRKHNNEYGISPKVEEQYLEKIKSLGIYNNPLCEQVISDNDLEDVIEWTLYTIVNKFTEDTSLMIHDFTKETDFINKLENFIIKAIASPKTNHHLLLITDSEDNLWHHFSQYESLLVREENPLSDKNGWSLNSLVGYKINTFPSNLHIVSIISK